MVEKVELIDVSRCIGCRSCQMACKQWNHLPAGLTTSSGTYQNPPDLQANTWMLIRFLEVSEKEEIQWLFWKEVCMHCTDASCVHVCPAGARVHLDYGAVETVHEKCIGCRICIAACAFGKPRYSEESNKVYKCNLCTERVLNGLSPACVKACPTGALTFGEKGEMIRMAYRRARELGGDASVYGDQLFGGTHIIYVLEKAAGFYSSLPARPKVAASAMFWKELLKPFGAWNAGMGLASIAAASIAGRRGHIA